MGQGRREGRRRRNRAGQAGGSNQVLLTVPGPGHPAEARIEPLEAVDEIFELVRGLRIRRRWLTLGAVGTRDGLPACLLCTVAGGVVFVGVPEEVLLACAPGRSSRGRTRLGCIRATTRPQRLHNPQPLPVPRRKPIQLREALALFRLGIAREEGAVLFFGAAQVGERGGEGLQDVGLEGVRVDEL